MTPRSRTRRRLGPAAAATAPAAHAGWGSSQSRPHIVPALILAAVAVPTVSTIFKLSENPGPAALQVKVVGKQWWWQFDYKDANIVTADELVIPTKRDVHVSLTACDATLPGGCNVIH